MRLIADDDDDGIEFGPGKKWFFDGKVGLYPLIDYTVAKRDSKLRKKGSLVPETVSLNAEIYNKYIINEFLPDIKKKCPQEMLRERIYVQHDNAPAHRLDEVKVAEKCEELGIDVEFFSTSTISRSQHQ